MQLRLEKGSGIIFDAEKHHAVTPLVRGQREVLVMEFWDLADASAEDFRPDVPFGYALPPFPAQSRAGCSPNAGGVYQRACWD